jgi:hypothetical protein
MAKTKVSEYSATAADNTDISNINIAEGCSPANVNNAIRSLMAQLKDMQAGTAGDSFVVGGNLSVTGTSTLTGNVTAPTQTSTDNSTKVATTAFVTTKVGTLGTIATQNANAVTISGGTVDGTTLGATTASSGAFTTLSSTGSTTFKALVTAGETTTVSATAATGTINYDVLTQGVLYYTSNASANWTLNVRGNSGTSLNTLMAVGETRTITFLVPQGSTAYYQSAMTIDGSSVTPKWQLGVTPSSGNASSIDVYVFSILKTASATYTVLASQTKFA